MNVKEDAPYIIGGVVLLVVIFAVMKSANSGGSGDSQPSVSYQVVQADQGVLAQQTAIETAKLSTIQDLFGGVFSLETAEAADSAAVTENTQNNAAAVTIANTTAQTQQFAAAEQAATYKVVANDQLSAQQAQAHAQQTSSFWNSLFSAVGNIAKAFEGPAGAASSAGGSVSGANGTFGSFGSYA